MPFRSTAVVELLPPPHYYKLKEPLVWEAFGESITIGRGFTTDFASIPRPFRWAFTGHGREREPAILHDFLYRNGLGTRKGADLLFKVAMRHNGVPAWKRKLMYWAVRVGGMGSWQGK